ncbi:MAG TPA: family 43 glycosylhydrolase, partial [Candidatus Paceibacterota bacterium]|nr:family 43 glycosylhydrolase [Candidatus Paceibacterota bacterium]
RIGVAIADKPYGPFKPEAEPIQGARGIDPCVLIDKDGSAYLYSSAGRIFVAKLKENMVELASPQQTITNLPTKGLLEGPFAFERNGIYYLTYPHVADKIERLEYSTSDNPLGPFKQAGVILDESASGCWTVHHSIVEYKGQWYLFYHDRDLSPAFDKNRSIRADRLFFNDDGSIRKVIPTLRGVGLVNATNKIQIDRYSAISGEGASVSFLNPANTFEGWKLSLNGTNAWARFNEVDFGKVGLKTVNARIASSQGGKIAIRVNAVNGPLVTVVKIPKSSEWQTVKTKLNGTVLTGVLDLFVAQEGDGAVDLDWISFE